MLVKNIINIIFKFSVFFVIIIMIGLLITKIILTKKDTKKSSNLKSKFFGVFMELDNKSIMSISIVIVKYIFIIYLIISKDNILELHLYIILLLSILYIISNFNIRRTTTELVSSFALYMALYSSKILSSYLHEIKFVWYVFVGNILLVIFIFMFATYFFIKDINDVVLKNKYIRKNKNAEN